MRRALAALAAVLALVAWRYAPPSPRGDDAPATEFCAVRAKAAPLRPRRHLTVSIARGDAAVVSGRSRIEGGS